MGTVTPPAPAVLIEDLSVSYGFCVALSRVCATIAAGSLTAIIGPNGAGKSTLLNAIAGLTGATERARVQGQVRFAPAIRGRIAYLVQRNALDRSFPITVLDLVALGAWWRAGALRRIGREEVDCAHEALAAVGLEELARRPVGALSAGQLQRALFARVMVEDARLILLDEPFNAVDAPTTRDLLKIIEGWHAEERTVIAVLHDLEQARSHFKEALLLARRCIASGPVPAVLTAENLARALSLPEEPVSQGALSQNPA